MPGIGIYIYNLHQKVQFAYHVGVSRPKKKLHKIEYARNYFAGKFYVIKICLILIKFEHINTVTLEVQQKKS